VCGCDDVCAIHVVIVSHAVQLFVSLLCLLYFLLPTMEPLSDLARRITTDDATSALCESFNFPETRNLSESFAKALVTIEQDTLDLGDLQRLVEESVELTAVGGRKDVLAALEAVKPLTSGLNLDKFDGLVVHCRGLVVLHVRLKNNCGRCANLWISDYRRELEARAASAKSVQHTNLQAVGLFAIFAGLCAVLR